MDISASGIRNGKEYGSKNIIDTGKKNNAWWLVWGYHFTTATSGWCLKSQPVSSKLRGS